jgi:Cd2+/Zn2+-exporting ATPase
VSDDVAPLSAAAHTHADHTHAGHAHGSRGHAHGPDGHAHDADDHGHAGHDHAGHDHAGDGETPFWRRRQVRQTLVALAAFALALIVSAVAPSFARAGFAAAVVVGLLPIARVAWAAATSGTPFSIESLLVIAAVGPRGLGAAEAAPAVVVPAPASRHSRVSCPKRRCSRSAASPARSRRRRSPSGR